VAFAIVFAASIGAGILQSVTGFGAAIFLMLFVPLFFDMVSAAAISSSITMGLGIALAWRFRKEIQWSLCALPTAIYMVCSIAVIRAVKGIDLDALTLAFGVFLVLLSVYFFLVSNRVSFSGSRTTACVCSAVSGVTAGLFGIGGPLMAVYFISASNSKKSYIANTQFLFGATNIVNLITRIHRGIYTADFLPVTALGLLGILLGKQIGQRIFDQLNPNTLKKGVYGFVGLSGLLTVLQNL